MHAIAEIIKDSKYKVETIDWS